MSEEQLKAFLQAVAADAGLQEKLSAAGDAAAVAAIASTAGFVISAEELQRAQSEISEDELEGVVGGGDTGWKFWQCMTDGACGSQRSEIGPMCGEIG